MPSPSLVDTALAFRPQRTRETERGDDGRAAIVVPKFNGKILGKYLMPRLRQPNFLVRLDEVGSFTWDLCDGSLTGEGIAERLAERFPDLVDPRGRAAIFLRQLLGQGHVIAVRPRESDPNN